MKLVRNQGVTAPSGFRATGISAGIKVSGKPLSAKVIAAAWKNLDFTVDPEPSTILTGAQHAYEVKILKDKPNVDKLIDLTLLNQLLASRGQAQVTP